MSNKKTSFKNWSSFDKKAVSFMIGMLAFCGACTALYIKEKNYKHAVFQGTGATINTACAIKMIRQARKSAAERN